MAYNLKKVAYRIGACAFLSQSALVSAADFELSEAAVEGHLDVKRDGRLLARYQFGYDVSTPERQDQTYKPFLHVFDAAGETPVTKGPGGRFPHHRGIFLGWNGIKVNGKSYDRWHMKDGAQVHREFKHKHADGEGAAFTSLIHWQGRGDEGNILEEERTMRFTPGPESAYLTVDVETEITALAGDTELGGDPEHAGLQFRPADDLDDAKTRYFFPKAAADPRQDLDYEWVGMGFTIGDRTTHVLYFNHPDNPRETRFSAYRDYGRFGGFFRSRITKGDALTLRTRFILIEGPMPEPEWIQRQHNEFTGRELAVPEVTERKAG